MEAGTLVEWLIAPGDQVRRGDVIAVVETQKGAIEVECFDEGTVSELIAQIGQTLPVGEPLARIGEEQETDAAQPAPQPHAGKPAPAASVVVEPALPVPVGLAASPAARRITGSYSFSQKARGHMKVL